MDFNKIARHAARLRLGDPGLGSLVFLGSRAPCTIERCSYPGRQGAIAAVALFSPSSSMRRPKHKMPCVGGRTQHSVVYTPLTRPPPPFPLPSLPSTARVPTEITRGKSATHARTHKQGPAAASGAGSLQNRQRQRQLGHRPRARAQRQIADAWHLGRLLCNTGRGGGGDDREDAARRRACRPPLTYTPPFASRLWLLGAWQTGHGRWANDARAFTDPKAPRPLPPPRR